ncbi:MAG: HAMP domain-containing histidine kinase [Frankiaceae bacterium]|nr:HAMP domain-containing histidine kinase [Frankiaceae bacterium]MBV9369761.1 HAMP domain-containing histidine kinase [Frankiales bacterium]
MIGEFGARVLHRWRGSLQTRVAVTTFLLSGLVVLLLGILLLQQIRNGVLDAKQRSSLSQLDFGLQRATDQFSAVETADAANASRTAAVIISELRDRSSTSDSYDVLLLATDPNDSSQTTAGDFQPATVPASLRQAVTRSNREAWAYTAVKPGHRPALIVGGTVASNTAGYQLYYLFPLAQEQQTLYLVERTMLLSGLLIVLLLVAIAAVVTRQVVRPVRHAAATAERLAAGRLRDRMSVRGEDDLASLASSFNRMAETVEKQISQLRELSRVQRRFVADVSHELRTPITTIRMAADVLHESRGAMTPELARSAELLQAELDRFEGLLADLLEISRHDAGAVVLDAEPVDLRSLVARAVDVATPVAERRGCELVVDVPDEPVVAEVDARRIDRVLRNLVANAIEHGDGQPVEVCLRGGDGGVCVTVRDRGRGLRPGETSLVFGRFWRADPARARTSGGTGLGLSIALEDARLHGGWLQAWGEVGSGSVFRLTLPWRPGEDIGEPPLPLDPAERVDVPEPKPEASGV